MRHFLSLRRRSVFVFIILCHVSFILFGRGRCYAISAGLFFGHACIQPPWAMLLLSYLKGEMLCKFLRCCSWPILGSTILGHAVFYFMWKGECCAILSGAISWAILGSTILGRIVFHPIWRGNAAQFFVGLCLGQFWGLPFWAMSISILCERGNAVQFSAGLFLGRSWALPFWATSFSIPFEKEMLCNFLRGCDLANFGVYHLGRCPFLFYLRGGNAVQFSAGLSLGQSWGLTLAPYRFQIHLKGKCRAIRKSSFKYEMSS